MFPRRPARPLWTRLPCLPNSARFRALGSPRRHGAPFRRWRSATLSRGAEAAPPPPFALGAAGMPSGCPPHGPVQVEMVPRTRSPLVLSLPPSSPCAHPPLLQLAGLTDPPDHGDDAARLQLIAARLRADGAVLRVDGGAAAGRGPPGDCGPATTGGGHYKPPGAAAWRWGRRARSRRSPRTSSRPSSRRRPCCRRRSRRRSAARRRRRVPPRPSSRRRHGRRRRPSLPRPCRSPRRFLLRPATRRPAPRPPQYVKPAKPVTFGFSSKSFLPSLATLAARRAYLRGVARSSALEDPIPGSLASFRYPRNRSASFLIRRPIALRIPPPHPFPRRDLASPVAAARCAPEVLPLPWPFPARPAPPYPGRLRSPLFRARTGCRGERARHRPLVVIRRASPAR